jgi:hypothetical protein
VFSGPISISIVTNFTISMAAPPGWRLWAAGAAAVHFFKIFDDGGGWRQMMT